MRKALMALTFSAGLGLLFQAPASAGDWPMFLNNATHISVAEKAPEPPLQLKWKFMTKGPVYSSPVIYNGKVYAGSYDGNLYALDAKTGKQVWSFKTGGEIFSTPAVADGKVYFGSKDKFVYALDAQTGKLAWKFETEGAVLTSPVAADGMVFIASMDLYVYGLNAAKGTREWRNKIMDYEKYSGIYSSPAYLDGAVYIAAKNGTLYSMAAKSGARNWKKDTQSAIYGSPVIRDGIIYIISFDRTLYATEAKTGKFVWRKNLDNDYVYAAPAVTKDKLYVPLKKGMVKVYNRLDGAEIAKFSFSGEINSTPVVTGNNLMFVTCDDGKIYAVDLNKKETVWEYYTNAGIHASPAVLEDAVFIGSEDGGIYAFEGK